MGSLRSNVLGGHAQQRVDQEAMMAQSSWITGDIEPVDRPIFECLSALTLHDNSRSSDARVTSLLSMRLLRRLQSLL